MKQCFKCKKKKRLNSFYVHKQMADGYLNKCKSCTKKDVQDRYNDPTARQRIQEYEKQRSQKPERKAMVKKYHQNLRKKDPEKTRIRRMTSNWIRDGKIKKEPCQVCGTNQKIQTHHTDYKTINKENFDRYLPE